MRLHKCGWVSIQSGERMNGMPKGNAMILFHKSKNLAVRKGGFYHIHITHKGE